MNFRDEFGPYASALRVVMSVNNELLFVFEMKFLILASVYFINEVRSSLKNSFLSYFIN